MGTGVTRILSQINVTESVAQHLCPSSSCTRRFSGKPPQNFSYYVTQEEAQYETKAVENLLLSLSFVTGRMWKEEPFSKDTTPSH